MTMNGSALDSVPLYHSPASVASTSVGKKTKIVVDDAANCQGGGRGQACFGDAQCIDRGVHIDAVERWVGRALP